MKRDHTQVGFNIEHTLNENNKISFIPYVGTRNNAQVLTTTATATTLATTTARLSEIERSFYGSDLRWDNNGTLGSMPYNIALGINYGKSSDNRLDTNVLMTGNPANILNRNEANIVTNFDQYVQGKLSVTPTIDLHAGARHTKVKLEVQDNFITGAGSNGDNSGSVEYQKTTPVIGAVWKATETLNFYANFGKGFETPTFIEAAFDDVTSGAGTPNLSLKPSESNNYELGLKSFLGDNTRFNLTFFHIKTKNEIVTNQTLSGRSSYTNANDTKRDGIEMSLDSRFDNDISTFISYTYLDAKFDSSYTTANQKTIASGNRIPGTYKQQLYGEVAWQYPSLGFFSALEGRYNSDVYVDDINQNKAPSYTVFNIRAGFEQNLTHWRLKEFIRLENITDKDYIGSVRVNDGNTLFFEPAAGRNYLIGLSAQYKF